MTDKTRDEVSRYDELTPRARWFTENFDEIDLADICANNEVAAAKAQAAVERVRALHQPDPGGRTGYQPDDDDTPGAYGDIAQACRECGSSDLAVRWPCPTVRALDAEPAAANPGEQHATRSAAIRDQSALAQIRLHIAAYRPRLQYADPILLGRLEAVLRQVGELEAAGGGEA